MISLETEIASSFVSGNLVGSLKLGAEAEMEVTLARLDGRTTMSSSSSSSSISSRLDFSGFSCSGEACLFLGLFSCVALVVWEGVRGEDFPPKKLEMVACLRFRDGDGAEDCEEWGAIVSVSPVCP